MTYYVPENWNMKIALKMLYLRAMFATQSASNGRHNFHYSS